MAKLLFCPLLILVVIFNWQIDQVQSSITRISFAKLATKNNLISARAQWKKVKDKGVAKVWRRKVDWTPWMQIRTWGIVEAPPDFCLELLLDNNQVGSYDSLFDGIDVVVKPDAKTVVRHMLYKAIWPTSPRDFITYTTHRSLVPGKKKSGYVIASKSVLHSDRPATKQRCRGTIYHFGYTLEPYTLKDGSIGTQARMCAHMDLAGGMPASIINFLSSSQPLGVMLKIQEIARRDYCGEITDASGVLFTACQKLNMPSQVQAFASKVDESCEEIVKGFQNIFGAT
eukprot:CAMPEP_0117817654 /NCGR_PEP_ID=MMETSP0949-20121206/780_1 /TAXON_ID=44440 /ORGANISM="Chattonella subsalsa, Strain CCMP2191" /LENGTH=284 /DNA_ID=CAMNT_0005656017 /DNA_START=22 /DNA_END=876 /DNA_ORIENTATION=-